MASLWSTVLLWGAAYAIWRSYKIFTALKTFKQVPKLYCVVDPLSILGGFVVPRGWWNPGSYITWGKTDALYARRNSETIALIPIFVGDAMLLSSSPEASKDILNEPAVWLKPKRIMTLDLMGENVVTCNPPTWRKHRKIAAPAFDNQTFANVWEVVIRAYYQMIATSDWKSEGQVFFTSFNGVTTRLALLVIAACGFNIQIDWEKDKAATTNLIDETVVTVSSHLLERAFVPRWLFAVLPALKPIGKAYERFEKFLHDEIVAKKIELARDIKLDGAVSNTNKNVFGRFVAASEREAGQSLDTSQIAGNLFIFLFAGHETTAHSLVVTLAFLASYPEEQERILNHIHSVIGDSEPVYEHYSALVPVLHCFYEAIRLYPPGWLTMREPATDEALQAPHLTATGEDLVVPKGTVIVLDTIGACRNPRHFPNPDAFVPTRWAVSEDPAAPLPPSMDTFLAFSSGPRTCLGKKFASVEAVCFLTLLLRDWKVELKLEEGETVDDWHKRILYPKLEMTLITGDVPLLFTRRVKE
ncbi:hypothetical protein EIP91_010751 [Steccherinum ochraceum]|uniref:Cytochrome P450-dit2 n=1 Tax=Steccherinum ochraceum TaxID=92696 RepID=A0A4R0RQI6_9APHY|nr:hypothetical protein EIP91_010751 [Steccherinum ochraceum]